MVHCACYVRAHMLIILNGVLLQLLCYTNKPVKWTTCHKSEAFLNVGGGVGEDCFRYL